MQCGDECGAWPDPEAQGSPLQHVSLLPALARQRAQANAISFPSH